MQRSDPGLLVLIVKNFQHQRPAFSPDREIKKILALKKPEISARYSVKEIGIFGSYVRGDQEESSDIDILVEYEKPVSLIEFVNLKNYLIDLLEMDVDLVMKKALKPNLGSQILREVVYV